MDIAWNIIWFRSITIYIEGILPKWPYLPCVSMAGRALLAVSLAGRALLAVSMAGRALLAWYPRYMAMTRPVWNKQFVRGVTLMGFINTCFESKHHILLKFRANSVTDLQFTNHLPVVTMAGVTVILTGVYVNNHQQQSWMFVSDYLWLYVLHGKLDDSSIIYRKRIPRKHISSLNI